MTAYTPEEIKRWKALIYGPDINNISFSKEVDLTKFSQGGRHQPTSTSTTTAIPTTIASTTPNSTPLTGSKPKWGGRQNNNSQTTPTLAKDQFMVQGESPWGTSKKSYRTKGKGGLGSAPDLF